MVGILYSLLAGIVVAMQGVFNAKLSEKAGFWLTNTFVHGTGFLLSILIFALVRDGNMSKLLTVNKLFLLGGALGVVIIFSVMKGITALGPAYSVALLIISQLVIAFLIDRFGWFGVEKVPFSYNKVAGLVILIAGVIVYKIK